MAQARITVLKRTFHPELTDSFLDQDFSPNGTAPCECFAEGQQFIVSELPRRPQGFPCEWAWADLHRAVALVLFGGGAPWIRKPGSIVACCTDGLRPVSFLIERIPSP